jgi:RNA polymerase-interacting CarD/CdnL/TRCF family regulator
MKLKVNTKIFYPGHGAGTIKRTQKIDFAGEVKLYYEFEFINNELTISTPVENVEKLGVRKINKAEDIKKTLRTLKKEPAKAAPSENYNELMNIIRKKDLSGDINEFVEIIQFCNHVKKERDIDKRLIPTSIVKHIKNCSYYLIGELALAQNTCYEKASEEFFKIANLEVD